MNPNKKVFFTFLLFVLAMVVIACLCVGTEPTPPSVTPPPPNPMPGLAGTWTNPKTYDVYEIAWQNNKYVVLSCTYDVDSYDITSQSWTGSSLTWSYYDTYFSLTVTITTTSLSGDYLDVNLSRSDGSSGTVTLRRGDLSSVTPFLDVTVTAQPQPNILTNPDSLTVTSAQAGIVTNVTGVSIAIPAGAVPANADGSIGSMIFSIAQDSTTVPSLPTGYVPVGPVVNLGPEGFVFEQPVTISLPIPSDVDPNTVVGATYYDPGQDTWVLVPASVDATNRTVEVATTHLSTWSEFGFDAISNNRNGGWFKVYRPGEATDYQGPDSRYGRAVTHHGICIRSVIYTDPALAAWWTKPENYTIDAYNLTGMYEINIAPWSEAATYWMPSGSYQLTEFYAQSEVNPGDPLYLPKYYEMWKDLGTVTLGTDQTVEFPVQLPSYNDPAWTIGRPPCWGVVLPAVGVGGAGGVQVTLNWNSNADLDLHVIEPGGEEIFYNHTASATGGQLDLDNQCSGFVLGTPENIFWATPPTGTYQVNVNYYEDCGGAGPVNFTIRVCIKGQCGNPISGTVNAEGDTVSVTSFTFP